jgi:hypothetical protein
VTFDEVKEGGAMGVCFIGPGLGGGGSGAHVALLGELDRGLLLPLLASQQLLLLLSRGGNTSWSSMFVKVFFIFKYHGRGELDVSRIIASYRTYLAWMFNMNITLGHLH